MADPDPVTLPTPDSIAATASTEAIPNANPDPGAPPNINVTPAAPSPTDVAPGTAPVPRVPRQWQPRYRSGIGGIVDEMRDALAGHQTQIYEDDKGTYVGATQQSNRQKWLGIVASLASGAGKGYAAGQGPGGAGRAFAAGAQSGMQQIAQQRQHTKEQTAEARQENLDRFNVVMQQLQMTKASLENTRLGMEMNESTIKFAQDQDDREAKLGSADLGVYDDHYNIADVVKQDPNAIKDFYNHKISVIPNIGPDGKQHGVHLWLRTSALTETIAPAGTPIGRFVPPQKPGDKGQIVWEKTTEPKKESEISAHNMAAYKAMSDFEVEQQKPALQRADIDAKKAEAKARNANAVESIAKANEANANARAKTIETNMAQGDILGGDVNTQAQALVDGRMAPSQLNKRAKDYDLKLRTADALSMQQTGQHYDLEQGEVRYQMYKSVNEEYAHGKARQSIGSFDMFLGHALETSQTVQNARNSGVPWLNTPVNKLAKAAGTKNSPNFLAFQQSLETTQREYQNFLNAGHAIDKLDKEKMDQIMNDSASPAQIQEGLKTYARLAGTRLRALDFNYAAVTGTHVPNLISPEGAESLKHFGVEPQSIYTTLQPRRTIAPAGPNVPPTGGAPATPAAPTATPVPAGGQPKIATKAQIQAFADAHKMTYDQAKQNATKDGYQVQE